MIYRCDLGMTPFLSFAFSLSHSSTYRQITLTGVAESVRVRGRSRAGEKKKGGTHGFSSCTRRFQLLPVGTVCTEDLWRLDRSQTDYIVSREYVCVCNAKNYSSPSLRDTRVVFSKPVHLRQANTNTRSWSVQIAFENCLSSGFSKSWDFVIDKLVLISGSIRPLVMENWKLI